MLMSNNMNILCRLGWHKMKPSKVEVYKSVDESIRADITFRCSRKCEHGDHKAAWRIPATLGDYHLHRNPRKGK